MLESIQAISGSATESTELSAKDIEQLGQELTTLLARFRFPDGAVDARDEAEDDTSLESEGVSLS